MIHRKDHPMTAKIPGRRRLEIVADPEFIDAVAAAAARYRLSVSAFIRLALRRSEYMKQEFRDK